MLYVTFKEPKYYVFSPKVVFNAEWLRDSMVQALIKDVDKTEVIQDYLLNSPIFGFMPPDLLSNGVKNLIITKYTDYIKRGDCYGDNCSYWLGEISKQKDVLIYLITSLDFLTDMNLVLQ